jgi:rsbT antagonist protein RsbS
MSMYAGGMGGNIAVLHLGGNILVSVPPDPDDDTVAQLQLEVLSAMERTNAQGLILDISTVETVDSYFARTISETVHMVQLMGGVTVLSGMRASVAVTTTQLGLNLGGTATALDVDRALAKLRELLAERKVR